MSGMNRNTDEIALFCRKFINFCEEVENNAKYLKMLASTIDDALQDEVGIKAIQKVQEFSDEIIAIIYLGEQPILELEKKNRQLQEKMKNLSDRMR